MNANGAGSRREGLTRRDFLLGAAPGAAAAAWHFLRRSPGSREIQGEIVGASHARAHRIRGGEFPPPARHETVPVVIVGAGIAGLSAGWKLRNSGFHDFRILELEPEAGGNSRFSENAVTPYPWGAHYVPLPTSRSTAVRELFEELGVIEEYRNGTPVYREEYLCHAPEERLFLHGRWHPGIFPRSGMTPEDQAQSEAFRRRMDGYRNWKDGRGRLAFALPMECGSDDAEIRQLDRISMREYLDREGWTSVPLRWYVDYCCRDDYGCTIDTVSAWAGLHYFCSREIEDPEVLTWPEGNGWIVRRLLHRLSGRVVTDALVHRIQPEGDGTAVDFLDGRTQTSVRLHARKVVFALPRFTARHILRGWSLPDDSEFTYSPWMVANLAVDRVPEGAAWDNVLHRSESLGYIVATHQSFRTRAGPGVLTYYRPFCGNAPAQDRALLLAKSWPDWKEEILSDLRRAHPDIDENVRRIDVMLWGHAMIRPVPGFFVSPARRSAAEPIGPVHIAHSDLSGLSLFEEAQYRGVKAAEQVLRAFGLPFRSSLEP